MTPTLKKKLCPEQTDISTSVEVEVAKLLEIWTESDKNSFGGLLRGDRITDRWLD